MYACICHAVSETEVELAVLAGAGTVAEVGEATAAGTGCGSCHPTLEGVLDRVACPLLALRAS